MNPFVDEQKDAIECIRCGAIINEDEAVGCIIWKSNSDTLIKGKCNGCIKCNR